MRFSEITAAENVVWLGVSHRRHAHAFLLAVAIVVSLGALMCAAPIWRLYAWLPSEALRSDRLRITHALATTWHQNVPDVLLLGGSQIREIMPDDDFASAELSVACGRTVRVLNAASSAQLPESAWAILDHFAQRPPPFIVVGSNLWRRSYDPANTHKLARLLYLLPRPTTMPPDAGALPLSLVARGKAQIGILFADALAASGFGRKVGRQGNNPFAGRQHQYSGDAWTPERKSMDARYQVMVAHEVSVEALRANVRAHLALAEAVAARGSRIGFLLTPYSPETDQAFREIEHTTSEAYAALSQASALLDLRQGLGLQTTDFYDTVHLLSSGRRKLWPSLKMYLLSGLRGCGPKVIPT